jgi:hypothetical protein
LRIDKAAGDPGLSPYDQAERDQVVEQPHAQESEPQAPVGRHATALCGEDNVQGERCDRHPSENHGERRKLLEDDLGEEERAAPEH